MTRSTCFLVLVLAYFSTAGSCRDSRPVSDPCLGSGDLASSCFDVPSDAPSCEGPDLGPECFDTTPTTRPPDLLVPVELQPCPFDETACCGDWAIDDRMACCPVAGRANVPVWTAGVASDCTTQRCGDSFVGTHAACCTDDDGVTGTGYDPETAACCEGTNGDLAVRSPGCDEQPDVVEPDADAPEVDTTPEDALPPDTDTADTTGDDTAPGDDASLDDVVRPDASAGPEICDNGLDDDANGWADCVDPSCDGRVPCRDINLSFSCGGTQAAASSGGGFDIDATTVWFTPPGSGIRSVAKDTFTNVDTIVDLAAGLYADIVNTGDQRVVVIAGGDEVALVDDAVGASLALTAQPAWSAVAEAANLSGIVGGDGVAYLIDANNGVLGIFSADSNSVVGAVALPTGAGHRRGAARIGDTLWVGVDGDVVRFDVADPTSPTLIGRARIFDGDGVIAGFVPLSDGSVAVAFDPALSTSIAELAVIEVGATLSIRSVRPLRTRGFRAEFPDLGGIAAGPADMVVVLGVAAFDSNPVLWYMRPDGDAMRIVGFVILPVLPGVPDVVAADASYTYMSKQGGGTSMMRATICTN